MPTRPKKHLRYSGDGGMPIKDIGAERLRSGVVSTASLVPPPPGGGAPSSGSPTSLYSGGTPTAIDVGDAAAQGSGSGFARGDHQHALPAPAAGYPVDVGAAEADGAATTVARADHKHAHGSGYAGGHSDYPAAFPGFGSDPAAINIGDAQDGGSSGLASESNHQHAFAAPLLNADGSAGAPSFSFSADIDTGIYRIGADNLGFSVGGVFAMGIDSNKRLGINTLLPLAPLHVIHDEAANVAARFYRYTAGAGRGRADFYKARGTEASPTTIVTGDQLGGILAHGHDGTSFVNSVGFLFGTEGVIATGVVPGLFTIQTADSAGVLRNALIVNSGQRLLAVDGTVAAPAFSFQNDLDTGIYRVGANKVGVGGDGVAVATFLGAAGATSKMDFSVSGGNSFINVAVGSLVVSAATGFQLVCGSPAVPGAIVLGYTSGDYWVHDAATGTTNFRNAGTSADINIALTAKGLGQVKLQGTGGVQIGTRPAFVAADKYLVVDANGNVHVSALGPLS